MPHVAKLVLNVLLPVFENNTWLPFPLARFMLEDGSNCHSPLESVHQVPNTTGWSVAVEEAVADTYWFAPVCANLSEFIVKTYLTQIYLFKPHPPNSLSTKPVRFELWIRPWPAPLKLADFVIRLGCLLWRNLCLKIAWRAFSRPHMRI